MPIVPVYLRVQRQADGLHFYVAECALAPAANGVVSLAGLIPQAISHLVLLGFNRL